MSEVGYQKVIGGDHVVAEQDTYTRADHARRSVPAHESGSESLGSILCAFGIALGVLALIHPFMPEATIEFPSMKYGLAAMACAVVGIGMGGDRDQMGKWSLGIATLGWLLGTVLAVLLEKSAY